MRDGMAKARHDLMSNHAAKPRVMAAAVTQYPVPRIRLDTPSSQA